MEEKPKIDEAIESLSEMSKIFDQIMIFAYCLDRLVKKENDLEKAKQDVDSFIIDFERCVKDFTNHETILTFYLKIDIDFSNMSIKDDFEKETVKKDFEIGESSQTISLRPQKAKTKPIFEKTLIPHEREILRLHIETIERLYGLVDTKHMIIDKSGIYPRIYFLQGSNPEVICEWFDFGSIATIYLTTPDFPEIARLLGWFREGVLDNFGNNSLIKIDDTLALDFFSASPDFDDNQTYPVWHFIRMRKVVHERNMISKTTKIFRSFT